FGSNSTWVTPRAEPKLAWIFPASPGRVGFRQTPSGANRVKFAPLSVDFHRPYGGRPGARVTTPPLETELTPRTARVEPTYMVPPLTTIDEMARPSKAGPVYAGAVPHGVSIAGTVVFAASFAQVVPVTVE